MRRVDRLGLDVQLEEKAQRRAKERQCEQYATVNIVNVNAHWRHRSYSKMVAQQVVMQHQIAEASSLSKATYLSAVRRDNQEAAAWQQAQRAHEGRAEASAALHHIQAVMTSKLLTEDPSVAASTLGEARIRPDHYKGMRPEQHQAVRAQQAEQAAAHEAARLAALQQEQARAAYQQAVLMQREAAAQQVG